MAIIAPLTIPSLSRTTTIDLGSRSLLRGSALTPPSSTPPSQQVSRSKSKTTSSPGSPPLAMPSRCSPPHKLPRCPSIAQPPPDPHRSLTSLAELTQVDEETPQEDDELDAVHGASMVANVNDRIALAGSDAVTSPTYSAAKHRSTGNAYELGALDIAFLKGDHSICKLDSVKTGSSEPEQPDIEDVIDPHAFPNIAYYEQLPSEATGSQAPLTIMRKVSKAKLSDVRKKQLEMHEKNRCKFEDKEDWEAFRKILVITDYQTCANEETVALFRDDINFFYGLQEAGAKSWIYNDGTFTLARCEDGYHIFDFDMERTCLISDDREKFFRFMTGSWKNEDGDIYWVRRENWGKELECSSDEEDWSEEEEEDVGNGIKCGWASQFGEGWFGWTDRCGVHPNKRWVSRG